MWGSQALQAGPLSCWFSAGDDFAHRGHVAKSRDIFSCHPSGRGVLLTSSE